MKKYSRLICEWWKTSFWKLIDFILPIDAFAKEIRNMTAEQFMKKASKSEKIDIPDVKTVFSYKTFLVQKTIWLFKYEKNEDAVRIFGEILSNLLAEWLEDLKTFENFANPLLIFVPMSPSREKERHGNHSERLCQKIIETLPNGYVKFEKQAFKKIRETISQTKTKNRVERLKNVSNSFWADPKKFNGRNVVLIEDVITTGATIKECRKTILESGARRVIILAIAH